MDFSLIKKAVSNFRAIHGRAPTPTEMAQIETQARTFARPTSGISGDFATPKPMAPQEKQSALEARAHYLAAKDPNYVTPDDLRDPFLVKSFTNRTKKGTNLGTGQQSVDDVVKQNVDEIPASQMAEPTPNVGQMADEVELGGPRRVSPDDEAYNPFEQLQRGREAEDIPLSEARWAPSTTPSADYFGQMSAQIERNALGKLAPGEKGKTVYEKLIDDFQTKTGRMPDEDELNVIVAAYNAPRHQYGEYGLNVLQGREGRGPKLEAFKAEARMNAIPEKYLLPSTSPSDYSQEMKDALAILRGEVPLSKVKTPRKRRTEGAQPTSSYVDEEGNVVNTFPTMKANGGPITTRDMLAEMVVNQVTPQKFSNGGMTDKQWREMQAEMNRRNAAAVEDYTSLPMMMQRMDDEAAMAQARNAPQLVPQPFSIQQSIRNKLAPTIGDKNVDKLIGGPQANLGHTAMQALNPLTYVVGFGDSMIDAGRAASQGDALGAGMNYGMGALNLIPFAGKTLTAGQKLKQIVNPATNKFGLGLTLAPEILKKVNE